MFRTGKDKANDDSKEWPIMEVKRNEDPYEDPWEKARDAKRAKVTKNVESRMRNMERAGMLSKGTTTRTMKAKKASLDRGREGGRKDQIVPPSGVPVDLPTRVRRSL